MFFGASKTFKSFVALDYALHRCYGLPWLAGRQSGASWSTSRPRAVPVSWKRIAAWHRLRHMDPAQMPMRVVTACLSLPDASGRTPGSHRKTGVHPSDIIIDTMSQTFAARKTRQRGRCIPARHR